MNTKYFKVIIYFSVILVTILALLLSMLRLDDSAELNLARWAACGIVFCVVMIVSVLVQANKKTLLKSFVMATLIPFLIIILTNILLVLLEQESLFFELILPPPVFPSILIFILSFLFHVVLLVLNRENKLEDNKSERTAF